MKMKQNLMLVTGAGGFVGRYMIDRLRSAGHAVRATDLPRAGSSPFPAGVEFIPADISQPGQVRPLLEGVKRVYHIAALLDYSATEERLKRVNVDGTRFLCEAAVESGTVERFVYWSTGSVYGKNPSLTPTPESYPPQPYVAYERTKFEGEQVCQELQRRYHLPVTILRPATMYGPGNLYPVGTLVRAMRRGYVRAVPGSWNVRGTYVHVDDVCQAALFLSEHARGADVFNIADASNYAIGELFQHLAHLLQVRPPRVALPGSVLKAAGWILLLASKATGRRPLLERDTIHYFLYDHTLDISKLLALGFQLEWPDTKVGMEAVIRSYLKSEAANAS